MQKNCFAAFLALALSACSTMSDQDVNTPLNEWVESGTATLAKHKNSGSYVSESSQEWWESFQEPGMNELVAWVLQDSFDTRRAILAVDRADAILKQQRANLFPTVGVNTQSSASWSTQRSDDPSVNNEIGLNGIWTPDLFKNVRTQIQAANADVELSNELLRDAKRLVILSSVDLFLQIQNTQQRIRLAEESLERLGDNLNRTKRLVEGGISTRLDLKRSEQQYYSLETTIATLRIRENGLINALALLTARTSSDLDQLFDETPRTLRLPIHLPKPDVEMVLRNRPDLRAADFRLISAAFSESVARKQLYPVTRLQLSLLNFGSSSRRLPGLDDVSASILGSIAMPLIGRGRIFAQIDQAEAETQIALLEYERIVLTAVLDIDRSLSNWEQVVRQFQARSNALDAAIEAEELARKLFYAGELDFTSVLIAEQTRLNSEQEFLAAEQQLLSSYVAYMSAVVPSW